MDTPGIISAEVSKETDSATVGHEASLSVGSIIAVIEAAGFDASVRGDQDERISAPVSE
jgi:copper chaperone CopZ